MTGLADIFQQYSDAYRSRYGEQMLPSHQAVLQAIVQCRTAQMGGHVFHCSTCEATHYSYHSCQNRHCPQCQSNQAQVWLAEQQSLLLPTPYFLLTFTLPASLRAMARSHQKCFYHVLFRASAAATQQLARDPRYVGGQLGMVGVLHTWGRNLAYHPHVHYLVPAGGLTEDGHWHPTSPNFLVPVKALSQIFRAKFRDALRQTNLFSQVPTAAWQTDWVVHCQPVGTGLAALKYLAPYIFRVAISNRRIIKVADDKVTFRYRATDTGQWRTCTLAALEFIRRFLQHVLPKGFVKVRYYGLFSPGNRRHLPAIRALLIAPDAQQPADTTRPQVETLSRPEEAKDLSPSSLVRCCPTCGGLMRLVQRLKPRARCPP